MVKWLSIAWLTFWVDVELAISHQHLQVVDDVHREDGSASDWQDEVEELSAVEDADEAAHRQSHDHGNHHSGFPKKVFGQLIELKNKSLQSYIVKSLLVFEA